MYNEDNDEYFINMILGMFFVGIVLLAGTVLYKSTERKNEIKHLSSRSDSRILLTTGRYVQEYYTTKSTIKTTEGGTCISFKDNSTNQPISACTQFIIKAN